MNKVKVGIIGCGNMAQLAHIPCLQAVNDAEIVALCGRREEVVTKLGKKLDTEYCVTSVEELLKLDIDAVYVLTPVQCHLQNIKAALAAGKHVFTEKPAAMSVESARELQPVAKLAGKNVTVGYMKRHEANIAAMKKLQKKSDWGKLLFVRTHSFIGSHWDAAITDLVKPVSSTEIPPFEPSVLDPGPKWLEMSRDAVFYSFDNPFFGLLDTGCHSINLLRHLTGVTPEVIAVKNVGGVRLVDFCFDGIPGVMEFCVNFAMHRWDEVTELYYEKASIVIKTPPPLDMQSSAEVDIYSEDGDLHQHLVLEDNRQWAFRLQAEAFISQVKSGNVISDLEEAEKDIEVIENIYKIEQGI
jgi:predicted dehydrogenase